MGLGLGIGLGYCLDACLRADLGEGLGAFQFPEASLVCQKSLDPCTVDPTSIDVYPQGRHACQLGIGALACHSVKVVAHFYEGFGRGLGLGIGLGYGLGAGLRADLGEGLGAWDLELFLAGHWESPLCSPQPEPASVPDKPFWKDVITYCSPQSGGFRSDECSGICMTRWIENPLANFGRVKQRPLHLCFWLKALLSLPSSPLLSLPFDKSCLKLADCRRVSRCQVPYEEIKLG